MQMASHQERLFLAAVLIGACAFGANGGTSDITGRVLMPDGQPALGARVYVHRASGVRVQICVDSAGRFRATLQTHGQEREFHEHLVAIQPGFGLAYWPTPEDCERRREIALRLPPEAILTGTVSDHCGRRLRGAKVMLERLASQFRCHAIRCDFGQSRVSPLPPLSTATDGRGRFTLRYLPKQSNLRLTLRVVYAGFAVAEPWGYLEDLAGKLDIVLRPGGALAGTVTHEGTGAPGVGIQVVAHGSTSKGHVFEHATSDQRGLYQIGSLPPATYTINVRIPPRANWTSAAKRGVAVRAEQTSRADLVLSRGGSISGQVLDATTRDPIEGVDVYACGDGRSSRAKSRRDGTFMIRCPPGRYRVRVLSTPAGYVSSALCRPRTVAVKAEENVAGLKFELVKGLTLVGKAVGDEGQIVAGVDVQAISPSGAMGSLACTNEEGAFRLSGLMRNARWILTARDRKGTRGARVIVSTEERDVDGVEINILPLPRITGRVVDSEGSPVPRARMTFSTGTSAGHWCGQDARADEAGRFEFLVEPGVPFAIRLHGAGSAAVRRRDPPRSGEHCELGDLIMPQRVEAGIEGRVVGPDGKTVPRAEVIVTIDWRKEILTCDAEGRFVSERRVPVGRTIGIAASDPMGLLAGETVVKTGKEMSPVILRLAKLGGLAGRVVNEEGHPIRNVQVGSAIKRSSTGYRIGPETKLTNAEGRFAFVRLTPGQAGYVFARARGYVRAKSRDQVFPSGESVEIGDLVLARAESFISGKVTDRRGRPVGGVKVVCDGEGLGYRDACTDAQGRYRIEGLPAKGQFKITASSSVFESKQRKRVKPGSTEVNFKLKPR